MKETTTLVCTLVQFVRTIQLNFSQIAISNTKCKAIWLFVLLMVFWAKKPRTVCSQVYFFRQHAAKIVIIFLGLFEAGVYIHTYVHGGDDDICLDTIGQYVYIMTPQSSCVGFINTHKKLLFGTLQKCTHSSNTKNGMIERCTNSVKTINYWAFEYLHPKIISHHQYLNNYANS